MIKGVTVAAFLIFICLQVVATEQPRQPVSASQHEQRDTAVEQVEQEFPFKPAGQQAAQLHPDKPATEQNQTATYEQYVSSEQAREEMLFPITNYEFFVSTIGDDWTESALEISPSHIEVLLDLADLQCGWCGYDTMPAGWYRDQYENPDATVNFLLSLRYISPRVYFAALRFIYDAYGGAIRSNDELSSLLEQDAFSYYLGE